MNMSQPAAAPPPPPPSSSSSPSPAAAAAAAAQQQQQPPPPPSPAAASISLHLYLDPSLENQVLKWWNSLARRHISTRLIDTSSRPHLPLLSFPPPSPSYDASARLLPPLRSLAARLDPLPLTLSAVSALPRDPPVLFLAPTPTLPLLHLHSQLADLARKEGADLPDHCRPDAWLPRCDVARDLPRARLGEAVQLLREMRLPVQGYAVELGLVLEAPDAAPRELAIVPLGASADR